MRWNPNQKLYTICWGHVCFPVEWWMRKRIIQQTMPGTMVVSGLPPQGYKIGLIFKICYIIWNLDKCSKISNVTLVFVKIIIQQIDFSPILYPRHGNSKMDTTMYHKGQLISKYPQKPKINLRISVLASKKRSNKKNTTNCMILFWLSYATFLILLLKG